MENTLTLEHVSAYLPYGLKIKTKKGIETLERVSLKNQIYNFKPILRPLSDLTKEIEHNGVKFVTKDFIHYTYPSEMIGLNPATWSYRVLIKLFELHFDIFNLIPQNLAIDINTLEL